MSKQKDSIPNQTQGKSAQSPAFVPDVKNIQKKEEQKEVAGRHKNNGQIDHKGAR